MTISATSNGALSGAAVIARSLRRRGIRTAFSLAGASHTRLLDELDRDGVRIISSRHEAATIIEADGYARFTGGVGVALIIADQGLPNAVPGIAVAHHAGSPVVVLVARHPEAWEEPEGEIDPDALELVRPITKWARTVHEPERLQEHLDAAFKRAIAGRPGPVVLAFPSTLLARVPASSPSRTPSSWAGWRSDRCSSSSGSERRTNAMREPGARRRRRYAPGSDAWAHAAQRGRRQPSQLLAADTRPHEDVRRETQGRLTDSGSPGAHAPAPRK